MAGSAGLELASIGFLKAAVPPSLPAVNTAKGGAVSARRTGPRKATAPRHCHGAGSQAPSTGYRPSIAQHNHNIAPYAMEDQGVARTARLVKVQNQSGLGREVARNCGDALQRGGATGQAAPGSAEDDVQLQLDVALKVLGEYLAKLSKNSVVVELSSRCGDVIVKLAHQFPDLVLQPTEGTGHTAHGLFLLLEEKVAACARECLLNATDRVQENRPATCMDAFTDPIMATRLMAPLHLDATDMEAWIACSRGRDVGCIFAMNTLQYVGDRCVELILAGCRQVLRGGGILFLCGPFMDDGDLSSSNLVQHATLQDFARAKNSREREVSWGLHDAQKVRAKGEALGLEFVALRRLGIVDPDDWLALVLRQPVAGRAKRPPPRQHSSGRASRGNGEVSSVPSAVGGDASVGHRRLASYLDAARKERSGQWRRATEEEKSDWRYRAGRQAPPRTPKEGGRHAMLETA